MTPSGMKIHASILVLSAVLLAACGPTRPPSDVLGNAQLNLASARSSGAATFAPLELRFAEERLEQAQVALQDRNYALATSLAEESEANSELAAIKARLGKLRESVDRVRQKNADIQRMLDASARDPGGDR